MSHQLVCTATQVSCTMRGFYGHKCIQINLARELKRCACWVRIYSLEWANCPIGDARVSDFLLPRLYVYWNFLFDCVQRLLNDLMTGLKIISSLKKPIFHYIISKRSKNELSLNREWEFCGALVPRCLSYFESEILYHKLMNECRVYLIALWNSHRSLNQISRMKSIESKIACHGEISHFCAQRLGPI